MAHRLLSERSSKCATPHGHNEYVTIHLKSQSSDHSHWGARNYSHSFEALKSPWHSFVDQSLDHALQLNENDPLIAYFKAHEPDLLPRLLVIKGDPTTEAVALALLSKLNALLKHFLPDVICSALELEETPTNKVVVTPEDLAACPIEFGQWCHRADLSLNDLIPPSSWSPIGARFGASSSPPNA